MALGHMQALFFLFAKETKLFNLLRTNIVALYHREALISRPDELSYGILKIQATKVRLCYLFLTVFLFVGNN